MDFKDFLPVENDESDIDSEKDKAKQKISQSQFYDIITSRQPDWQQIIYDLIHTEQLDPMDIDLVLLTKKYFEKIEELEQADFYISSKVLLAAALLLRIKSEFLLNKYIPSIDEILFGKKEEKKYVLDKIQVDVDELPLLIPKTPLPRSRRVTLDELMSALNKAINTESRRIKREVAVKRANKLAQVDIPEIRRINLKERIRNFYARVLTFLKKKAKTPEKDLNKVGYSSLIGKEREEKIASFLPLLHLSNTQTLWLEQEKHLDEIWIYLYNYFEKNKDKFVEELEEDIEGMREELGISENLEDISEKEDIKPRVDPNKSGMMDLEKLEQEIEQKILKEKISDKISEEIDEIKKENKIEKASGFSDEQV